MTKKLALLTIIPSLLWFLAINSGYSQSDLNNEAETVVPLYYSYSYNVPLSNKQVMLLEYWMICDFAFENPGESCYYLDNWMLNDVSDLVYDKKDLEDWMLSDMLDSDFSDYEMSEWMLGFEPMVESALYKGDRVTGVEDWMLEFNAITQQLLMDAYMSIKEWMLSNSFHDHDAAVELEEWMIEGLSMN